MLPFLLGAYAGKAFGEIVFSRAILLMLVWCLIPWAASSAAIGAFHAPAAGYAAGIATMLALLLFATSNPRTAAREALLEGLTLWCGLAIILAVLRVMVHMIGMGPVAGLIHEARWTMFGMAAVAVAAFAGWRIERGGSGGGDVG